ncbi:MAG TPA: hypothetical protein VGB39_00090 [Sphingomicrobium sp.]
MGLALVLLLFLGATLPAMLAVFIPLQFLISRNLVGWGVIFVTVLAVLVLIDLNYNWDGISYPFWWVGLFAKPWISLPVLFAAFVYAASQLSKSRELGDVDPR